jgi:hypothetical protein
VRVNASCIKKERRKTLTKNDHLELVEVAKIEGIEKEVLGRIDCLLLELLSEEGSKCLHISSIMSFIFVFDLINFMRYG